MYNKILIEDQGVMQSIGDLLEFILNKYYKPTFDLSANISAECKKVPDRFYARNWISSDSKNDFAYNYNSFIDTPDGKKKVFSECNNIVLLTMDQIDMLFITSIFYNRIIDVNEDLLEVNTYHKLNKKTPYNVKSQLNLIVNSYNLSCDENNPNIDRYILREFFKFGFQHVKNNGFLLEQEYIIDHTKDKNIYKLPLSSIYNFDKLIAELTLILDKFKVNVDIDINEFKALHEKFISNIKFLDIKKPCDDIINAVITKQSMEIPKLKLFQESYINAQIENQFDKEMPFMMADYFTNTKQIIEHLGIE